MNCSYGCHWMLCYGKAAVSRRSKHRGTFLDYDLCFRVNIYTNNLFGIAASG